MLHPLAQDALYRLTAPMDRGRLERFFVRFWDRLAELDRLARREHRRPVAQDDIERLDEPLEVGGLILRRPSVAAMEWLRTRAAAWWGTAAGRTADVRMYTLAVAWAEAHRERAAFDGMRGRFAAKARILFWAAGCAAGEEALRRAALSLLPPPDDSLNWFDEPGAPDEDEADDARPADLGALALDLSKHYGRSPEYWLWECSDDDFWGALCLMHDETEAKADGEHKQPDSWWRRHRRALARCETALAADVDAWMKAEDAREAAGAAERAARLAARAEARRKAEEAAQAAAEAAPAPDSPQEAHNG